MKKIVFLLANLIILSCSTSIYNSKELPPFIKNEIILTEYSDSTYLNVNLFSKDVDEKLCYDFLKSIDSISIKILSGDFTYQKTKFKENFHFWGLPSNIKGNTIVLPINIKFPSPSISLEHIKLQITIYSDKELFSIKKEVAKTVNPSPLSLYPVILNDKDKIEIGILAIRNKIIEEYIPSSEELRLEVINFKGKKIFSSQTGINFLQIILPVFPENIGSHYLYKKEWNLKDNEGNMITPGKYTLKLMIPALPSPYKVEIMMAK